jgi:putative tricarboxylic transport membrane protein
VYAVNGVTSREEISAARAARAVSLWKSLNKSELITAFLLIALGVYVAWEAWEWPYMTKDGPGPGFFPLWIGALLIALSVLLIALQVADAGAGRPVERTKWAGTRYVLIGWAALMAAAGLLEPAGFVVSYTLLCAFLIRVVFQQSWFATLAVSLVSAGAFWYLFVQVLKLRLPAGPLGF